MAQYGIVVTFIVFLLIAFGMIPLTLKFYVYLLKKSGTAALAERVFDTDPWPLRINRAIVRLLLERFWLVVIIIWSIFALGILIALPAMIMDGYFNPEAM